MKSLQVIFITGPVGSGKSTFIRELILFLSLKKFTLKGIYSKGLINPDGTKDFILCNISGSDEVFFATMKPVPGFINNGSYFFNPAAIKYGESILEDSLKSNPDLIIIDEIGPVEINDKIWASSLSSILEKYKGILILTIRKNLVNDVKQKFNIETPVIYELKSGHTRQMLTGISDILLGRVTS